MIRRATSLSSDIVGVSVRRLCQKIDRGSEPQMIHTSRSVGYTLKA